MKISIIVPTRNGSPYLEYCLKSCLDNDCRDIEVVVSDNFSTDNTREIAEKFSADPRLRYYNTGESVSMRRNYEFALSKASGDYVVIIGDDDGMTRSGLELLRSLLAEHEPDAVNWIPAYYTWPRRREEPKHGALHYKISNFFAPPQFRNPEEILAGFCAAKLVKYRSGACLYHGCIRRDIIESLTDGEGIFFHAQNPDVYSCLALLTKVRKFISLGYPVSIGGESEKSIGYVTLTKKAEDTEEDRKVADNFFGLLGKDPVCLELNPKIRSLAAITYASLNRVNEHACGKKLPIDHGAWRRVIVREMHLLSEERKLKEPGLLEDFFAEHDPAYIRGEYLSSTGPQDRKRFFGNTGIVAFMKRTLYGKIPRPHMKTVKDVADWLGTLAPARTVISADEKERAALVRETFFKDIKMRHSESLGQWF